MPEAVDLLSDAAAAVIAAHDQLIPAVAAAATAAGTSERVHREVIAYVSQRGVEHWRIAAAAGLSPVEVDQIVREESRRG